MSAGNIASDIQSLAPGKVIDLFVVDATKYGQGILRYHSGTNSLETDIIWQGNTYTRFPVEITGFEKSGKGVSPRPQLTFSKVGPGQILATLLRQYNYFMGCKVTRKRTLAKYLDAANFPGGVNPLADPNSYFMDEIFYVDRMAEDSPEGLQLELAAATDIAGVAIPRRQIVANLCPTLYRSAECGYSGGAVAKADDTPTALLAEDVCGKRPTSCKLRFGANAQLPYGGFASAGLLT